MRCLALSGLYTFKIEQHLLFGLSHRNLPSMPSGVFHPDVDALLSRCVGKKVVIPDLMALLPSWEPRVNTFDDELDREIEKWRLR